MAEPHKTLPESRKRKSIEDMIANPKEAERILEYITGDRNKAGQHKITNFESFKEAFRQEFMRGGANSNVRLWDTLGSQEDLLLKLYGETSIQNKVTENTKEFRTLDIMAKYHVQRHQANEIYKHEREQEIQLIREGKLPSTEGRIQEILEQVSPTNISLRMQISQVTKEGGIVYKRSKPTQFTQPEMRFLKNNLGKGIPTSKLTSEFNILFAREGKAIRTESSIYNKVYRLSRTPNL